MNILITGSAGYLGSILAPMLLKEHPEAKITALDNFMQRVPSLYECCHYKNFNIIRGDVRDRRLLKEQIPKYDTIIWLAAIVGVPACKQDPFRAEDINHYSVEQLFYQLSKEQRVIFPCTNSGYKTEAQTKICDEHYPLEPDSLYGQTKVKAEQVLLQRENTVSLRLATLFGMSPRMRIDLLVNDFVYRALKDNSLVVYQGNYMRNIVHVRDAARAIIHTLDNWKEMKSNVFNVGLPEGNLTKLQLCERIKVHIPSFYYTEAPYREDPDKRNFALNSSKLLKTGFRYLYSLDDGIEELIKGYQMIENRRLCNVV